MQTINLNCYKLYTKTKTYDKIRVKTDIGRTLTLVGTDEMLITKTLYCAIIVKSKSFNFWGC